MSFFFVTGLARSRTAWFSNYLTYCESFCYHDPFFERDAGEMVLMLRFNEIAKHRGISEASLLTHWRKFRAHFPSAKWMVVKRPFEEVFESCCKFVEMDREKLEESNAELHTLIEEINPMIVDFHNITPQVALKVSDYFGINTGGRWRADLLCDFNVQIHPPVLKSAIDKVLRNETVLA